MCQVYWDISLCYGSNMLLLWTILILYETVNVTDGSDDVRDELFSNSLVTLSEIQNVDKDYIHIAMIMCESIKKDSKLQGLF